MNDPEVLRDQIMRSVHRTPAGCWLWEGARDSQGFPLCYPRGTSEPQRPHRVLWGLDHGGWPAPAFLDNTCCREKDCVRPDHWVEVDMPMGRWMLPNPDRAPDHMPRDRIDIAIRETADLPPVMAAEKLKVSTETVRRRRKRMGLNRPG